MQFGELRNVDLRRAWPNEAHDFTPWLSENLERLSRIIGIQLDLEDVEVAVEQFAADILARNQADDSPVLIENQLQDTDHTHLGQILTYLAGLEAKTIIWIARGFQQAHLSAIRWLNENTLGPFSFFAVRVRVVQIGDDDSSPVAPLFEVLERPIDWDRKIRKYATETSEHTELLRQFRRDFWRSYKERYPDDIELRPEFKNSNIYHEIAGVTVSQYLAQKSVGVFIQRTSAEDQERVRQIEKYEEALSTQGVVDRWDVDSNNRDKWPEMVDWLHNTLLNFRRVLTESGPDVESNEDT